MINNENVREGSRDLVPDESVVRFRRVVTGHDDQGRSVFLSDASCPYIHCLAGMNDFTYTDLWRTTEMPVNNTDESDHITGGSIEPAANGSVFRIMQFPPGRTAFLNKTMHRTATIDYCYIVSGEIVAALEEGEKTLHAGDVLIQRGTNHAWINTSDEPCVILFVLMDADPV